MSTKRAYQGIIDFIASGTTPDTMIDFRPSETTKQRVANLIQREKVNMLSPDETQELNDYLQLEHLMRLIKTRTRHYQT